MSFKKRIGVVLPLLGGVGIILGIIVGVCSQQWYRPPAMDQFHGTWIEPAREIQSFAFEGIDKQAFTQSQLQGRWTWVFFGFTTCPQLCPTTMAKLAKAYQQLKQQGVSPLPRIVMMTLDPKQDTLAKLGQYVHRFEPDFYGAKGKKAQMASFAHELGIAYIQTSNTIEHTGAVMVLNPEGKLQAFFNSPFSASELVENHQLLIKKVV